MLRYIPRNVSRTLEIGCASGVFSQQLKKDFGCETWGIEPYIEAGNKASGGLDKVFITSIEDALDKLPENYFDRAHLNSTGAEIYTNILADKFLSISK